MSHAVAMTRYEVDIDALNPIERHYHDQALAVWRVFSFLHPDRVIRVVLRTIDAAYIDPNHVEVRDGDAGLSDVVGFVGFAEFGADGGLVTPFRRTLPEVASEVDVTIVVGVPEPERAPIAAEEKTSPDFGGRPGVDTVLRASPILFEQLKYEYDMRRRRNWAKNHSFDPVPRDDDGDHLSPQRDLSRTPSIIIGFHWLEIGGAENLAFDCVRWARAAGFRVLVLTERAGIHRSADVLSGDDGVEFLRADAYLKHEDWAAFLCALVEQENVCGVHIHHNTPLYASLQALKARFPDVTVIDSTHITEHANGGFPRISGVWTNYVDHHHVISRDLADFYERRFGVIDRVTLGRMLDADGAEHAPGLRMEAGQASLRLAFVGRMVHQKRAPLMVEITRRLRSWAKGAGIELSVDMVGTGAYLDVVRRMIDRASLQDVITLHPAGTDVRALLKTSDILILPSGNEGLALVCYEAIESGAIPISTDVGGQGELIAADLLVSASPLACIRETVSRVKRLWTDDAFLSATKAETISNYGSLRADPKAEGVVSHLYRDLFQRSDV